MTLPNLTTTTETVNTEWLRIARPIIKAMFAVEDAIAPVTTARLADPKGYAPYSQRSAAGHAWMDAQGIAGKACEEMRELIEGIRDNALCDAYADCPNDATDDEADAIDEFNDDLRKSVLTVGAAVRMVSDEQ